MSPLSFVSRYDGIRACNLTALRAVGFTKGGQLTPNLSNVPPLSLVSGYDGIRACNLTALRAVGFQQRGTTYI